jgi:hypothetical protein
MGQTGHCLSRPLTAIVAAMPGLVLLIGAAAPAVAAEAYPAGAQAPPQVLGETFFKGDPPAGALHGVAGGPVHVGPLAFSGLNVLLLLAVAIVATAVGLVLWRAGRDRAAPPTR